MMPGAIGQCHRTPLFPPSVEIPRPPSDKRPEVAGQRHRTPQRTHRTPQPSDTTGGVIYPQSVAGPKRNETQMTDAATETTGMVGTLTSDPALRFSNAGKPWTKFRMSVKPWVRGADVQPDPVFYDVVSFGSLAENVAEALSEGDRVTVAGTVETENWTGRDGKVRTGQRILASGIGADLRFSTSPKAVTRSNSVPAPKPETELDRIIPPSTEPAFSHESF
jgi:single stranded DNA-binding protein